MPDTWKLRIGWLIVALIAVLIVGAGVFVLPSLWPDKATSFRAAPSDTGTHRATTAVTDPVTPMPSPSYKPQTTPPAAVPSAAYTTPAPHFTQVEIPVPTYAPPTYRRNLLPPLGSSCRIIDHTIAGAYLGGGLRQVPSTSFSSVQVDGCTWQSPRGSLTYSISDLGSREAAAASFATNQGIGRRPASVAFSPQLGDYSAGFNSTVQGVGDTTLIVVKGQYVLYVAMAGTLDSWNGAMGAAKFLLSFTS
ncbi:hypothetical protein AHiyo8_pI69750 (plasmid) [Arthrobacter sp. Hiyo8]|uniref:hypothetical protein n=1 Tax=Arthrobacter sp. Hiyo1 TaxID=1588020 RepID=UPI000683804C|nr:hypothetical protein [Arthrobacter sp. Hiyo1]BAS18671.1 hypothetical protein AHiyo8_pI69750 [Arthrobacter sp. Hiyo8]GAP60810.1 hypothetical protein AHiyo1_44030 [Arthrobacter sp. Hiyo1]